MDDAAEQVIRYDSAPAITIIADTSDGLARAKLTALGAGGRITRTAGQAEGRALVETAIGQDAILLDLESDQGPVTDVLLSAVVRCAEEDRIPVLITAPAAMIDPISRWTGADGVSLLVDAEPVEAVTTLAMALNPESPLVADVATEMDAIRLQRLADEVSRIAKALSNLTGDNGFSSLVPTVQDVSHGFRHLPEPAADLPDPAHIRAMIRLRRLRDRFFQPDLFADPAWDMLLDLAAAHLERSQVAVSSLCIAAAVPPTTALRWIKAMTDQGLLERCADPDDGCRIFIRLSPPAAKAMFSYLSEARRQGGFAV